MKQTITEQREVDEAYSRIYLSNNNGRFAQVFVPIPTETYKNLRTQFSTGHSEPDGIGLAYYQKGELTDDEFNAVIKAGEALTSEYNLY